MKKETKAQRRRDEIKLICGNDSPTVEYFANRYRVPKSVIRNDFKILGLTPISEKDLKREKAKSIILKEKLSGAEIARITGLTTSTICILRKKMGIKASKNYREIKEEKTKREIVIEMRRKGHSIAAISREVRYGYRKVKSIIVENFEEQDKCKAETETDTKPTEEIYLWNVAFFGTIKNGIKSA